MVGISAFCRRGTSRSKILLSQISIVRAELNTLHPALSRRRAAWTSLSQKMTKSASTTPVRQLIETVCKIVGTDDVERDAAPFRRLLQKAVDGQKLFGVQKRVDREQTSLHIASAYIIAQRRAKAIATRLSSFILDNRRGVGYTEIEKSQQKPLGDCYHNVYGHGQAQIGIESRRTRRRRYAARSITYTSTPTAPSTLRSSTLSATSTTPRSAARHLCACAALFGRLSRGQLHRLAGADGQKSRTQPRQARKA